MAFKSLTQDDGLSQNTVNDIWQDSYGFLWLATEGGLNRYDGVGFTVYQRNPKQADSLPGNFVWAIAEDDSKDLWLATRGAGLVKWHRDSDTFSQALDITTPPFSAASRARSLLIDQQQQLWLGTQDAGLLQLTMDGQLIHWYAQAPEAQESKTGSINALIQDHDGQILVASDKGLWRVDQTSKQLQAIPLLWPQPDQTPNLSSLLRSHDGSLWVGSFGSGLLQIDQGKSLHFTTQDQVANSLSHPDVRDLLQDEQGRIWVATQNGLNLYRDENQDFTRYHHVDSDPYSLSDNLLMSLAQDNSGLLWVGSRVGGLNRWNPRSWALGAQTPSELAETSVLAFADDPNGNIWVGSFGAPLQRFNPAGLMTARFSPEFGFPKLAESPVTALLRGHDERLWIGTFDAGLQIYNPTTKRLDQLQHIEDQADSLGANGIMCLLQDANEDVWVGSFGGGVSKVDQQTLQITRIAPKALGGIRATALAQDQHEQIWIATDGDGLFRYVPSTKALSHFPSGGHGPGSNTLYSLHNGIDGRLWLGTDDAGLQFIAPSQLQAEQITVQQADLQQALPDQTINGIRSDEQGQLWVSTNRGLVRIQPQTGAVREFHKAHGLQSQELNFGAHYRARDGRLYFGGAGGYNQFKPANLDADVNPAQLVITGFEKFNRPVRLGQTIGEINNLSLAHNDDVISFTYALMDFTDPRDNRYSIKLEGFDRSWSPPQKHARSTYTNLDPGDYVFKVRGLNSDGVWTETSRDIALHVKTAPWATPWAKAAYVLASLLLLLLLYRWRIQVVQREARIEQLAYYDDVTGLPNRDLFEQRCRNSIKKIQNESSSLCLIVLQVGNLKQLHDSLGYRSSHDIYRSLSARLSQALFGDGASAASRELARLNDDAFVVLLHLKEPASEGMRWAQQLVNQMQQTLEFGDHKVSIPANAGIACYPQHGQDAESLIEHASTAAHDQSANGAGSTSFYEPEMTRRARERLALESDLRHALRNNELQLFLQGKFTPDGQLVGAEALTRWTHPQRGPISPGVFIPLAEESELIMELDDWVMDQAYASLADWKQRGLNGVNIAVNVSAETFVSGRIFSALERNKQRYEVDASHLEIEVTESVLASDLELITDSLHRIKSMMHTLSLDDFGTGYSSLTYLQQFPIDKLKIDQAFVKDLENQAEQQSLCKAIIALAQSLNLSTVAEGVENQAQLDLLTELGCDHIQGYFLHRPQAAQEFQSQYLRPATNNE